MQRLRRLSGRRGARLEEGRFVIDGPTLLAEALRSGVAVEEVFTSGGQEALVRAAAEAGATVREVSADVLARATDTTTSQGVAAVAARVEVSLEEACRALRAGPLGLVLVDVGDPGNAGTLVRAAEAAGAAAVLFCGSSVDPSNGKCVRASAGALFHVPIASGGEVRPVLEGLGELGVRRVATVVDGGAPYDEADLTGPVALVLGSEAHGLPAAVDDLVDERVTIPMVGRSESLNVAMAGAVLCFESLRQRRLAR
ncbi:MAG: TrmH family RNA methyltransferase [Acidimicrobiales bacterium]